MDALHDGRYRIDELLGTGQRTVVYAAHDLLLDAPRALKLLRGELRDDLALRQRYLTEARALARVTHPNVVRVYDFFVDERHGPCLVMEQARGVLRDVEPAWPLAPRRAAEVGVQLLAGLGVLHGLGIVHRDLRLDNLLLGRTGSVLVSDLASSRLDGEQRLFHTQLGEQLGLAMFVAPECRDDPSKAVAASDVYSVGALLYALLTGNAPPDLSLLHLDDRILTRLVEPFRPVVKRATAHRIADRYPSAGAMRSELAGLQL
jgi:serine/threonine-protein kinase